MLKKAQYLLLNPVDDVVVALEQLISGMPLVDGVKVAGLIPAGHKAAIRPVEQGQPIRRYGQIIGFATKAIQARSEEHTSELQSLMRISYAVFCLKKKTKKITKNLYNLIIQ